MTGLPADISQVALHVTVVSAILGETRRVTRALARIVLLT